MIAGSVSLPSLFFSKICLTCLFKIYLNIRMNLSIFAKKKTTAGILNGITLNLLSGITLKNWHACYSKSSNSWCMPILVLFIWYFRNTFNWCFVFFRIILDIYNLFLAIWVVINDTFTFYFLSFCCICKYIWFLYFDPFS